MMMMSTLYAFLYKMAGERKRKSRRAEPGGEVSGG
jgi:hypothetical protein